MSLQPALSLPLPRRGEPAATELASLACSLPDVGTSRELEPGVSGVAYSHRSKCFGVSFSYVID